MCHSFTILVGLQNLMFQNIRVSNLKFKYINVQCIAEFVQTKITHLYSMHITYIVKYLLFYYTDRRVIVKTHIAKLPLRYRTTGILKGGGGVGGGGRMFYYTGNVTVITNHLQRHFLYSKYPVPPSLLYR